MKMLRLTLLISSIACASLQCGTDEDSSKCPTVTCKDYLTQATAQAAFDADKTCMKGLDEDGDGIACEHLAPGSGGGGGANCPTTGNCGCSNKTKAACDSECCKWIVGTGCKCR